jgi:DNA-binding CsgD family transcriptional regulator
MSLSTRQPTRCQRNSSADIGRAHLAVSTVESHLKRTYAKLAISSRRDLMRERKL